MKKQSTLFPGEQETVIAELDLKGAEEIAAQIKREVEAQCSQIETVGSIRRQRAEIHDVDFVVVAKNNFEWQKINEKLKRMKARPSCAGNSLIKALVPFKE